MTTNTQLIKIAEKHLGQGGAVFRKYCGLPSGAAWCNAYVDYVANEGGVKSLYFNGRKETYCPNSIKWCNANLAQVPLYWAMPADIIYFDWERNGRPNHIGLVRARKDTASIYTIEGNTDGGKVARKTRASKYIQGVYRPHFGGTYNNKPLALDGAFEYQSIGGLQVALKGLKYYTGSIDTILGKGTMKAFQKLVGASQDGAFGPATAKKAQTYLKNKGYYKGKIDGAFGKESTIALQKWCNANTFKVSAPAAKPTAPAPAPKPTAPAVNSKAANAVAWGRAIAKGGKYKYKKWNNKVKATKLCPICHKLGSKYQGWNCIGFVSACLKHGGGIPVTCSCSGIGTDSFFTKVTEASWKKRNGSNWTMISNGGKKGGASIPASKLLPGDVVICYDGNGKFKHVVLYSGDGKFLESTNGKKPNIAERKYSDLIKAKHATRAFRYKG